MDVAALKVELDKSFNGVLYSGTHKPGSLACVLEFASVMRHGRKKWSDAPGDLPDLRPLNDALWSSDAARTEAILPVLVALWDWGLWSDERRVVFAKTVALCTIQEVLPVVLRAIGLEAEANACLNATDLDAAWTAAEAAAAAAGAGAGAAATAWATAAAAWAAWTAPAAADRVLILACEIFVKAAQVSE